MTTRLPWGIYERAEALGAPLMGLPTSLDCRPPPKFGLLYVEAFACAGSRASQGFGCDGYHSS